MKVLSIGRESSNEIILHDNFVSRKHAQLVISDNGQSLIKDMGSSNGTFVNGNKVKECYLKPGDVVKCAAIILDWQQYAVNQSPKRANPVLATPLSNSNNPGIEKKLNDQFNTSPVMETKLHDVSALPGNIKYQADTQNHIQQEEKVVPMQQNVIVMGKAKSVGVAFILAFFFGPLGLLYASILGGIVMFFISLALFFLIPIVGYFIAWIGCVIWAVVAANQANAALQTKAGGLINNNFQR